MGVRGVVPQGRELRRASVEDDPAADEDEPRDDVLHRAELVGDVEDRHPELVAQLATTGVTPRVLFITGYSEEAVHSELKHPVLTKPFTAASLCEAIRRAVAG